MTTPSRCNAEYVQQTVQDSRFINQDLRKHFVTQKRLLFSEIGRKFILHRSVKQYVGKCGAERHLSIKGGTEQVRQLCWQATILAPYQTLCTSYYADTFASICIAICRHHNEAKFILKLYLKSYLKSH